MASKPTTATHQTSEEWIESAAALAREHGVDPLAFRRALRAEKVPTGHRHGEHYRIRRDSPEHHAMMAVLKSSDA